MQHFRVSRLTVAKAVAQLVTEGYLERRPGSGTYVRHWRTPRRGRPKQKHIAMLLPYAHDRFMSTLIKSLSNAFYAHDCAVHFYDTNGKGDLEAQHLRSVLDQDVDGLIAFPVSMEDNGGIYQQIVNEQRPLVLVDRYFPDMDVNVVATDNVWGARRAVSMLIAQGHTRIGLLYPTERRTSASLDRRQGYERALLDAGLPVDLELISEAGSPPTLDRPFGAEWDQNPCRSVLQAWLSSPLPPTAIFCTNDYVLQTCLIGLRSLGKKVPEEVAMAGFCDMGHWLAHVAEPFLGVRQQTAEIGQQAADMLLQMLAEQRTNNQQKEGTSPKETKMILIRPHIWSHASAPLNLAVSMKEANVSGEYP